MFTTINIYQKLAEVQRAESLVWYQSIVLIWKPWQEVGKGKNSHIQIYFKLKDGLLWCPRQIDISTLLNISVLQSLSAVSIEMRRV